MVEFWKTVLAFICGAGGLALINIIQERWKWRHDRKAAVEDRQVAKEDKLDKIEQMLTEYVDKQNEFNDKAVKRFEALEKKDAEQAEAMKCVLLDRIIFIGQSYIKKGEVTFDDRKRLREMHDVYHNKLKGNGDADFIMKAVDELPLKQ